MVRSGGRLRRNPERRRAGEVCALTTARLSRRHASCADPNRPLSAVDHPADHHRAGDRQLAVCVQRAQRQLPGRPHLRHRARPRHGPDLPADPGAAAGLRRARFFAVRRLDHHPGTADAAQRRRFQPDLLRRMTGKRIDGKAAAAAIHEQVAARAADFESRIGRPPGLATVLVGENPASAVYVRSKNRATAEAGMLSFAHNLPATTSEDELLQLVIALNADERVDGILVQLPLPQQVDATRVIETIDPSKDVDGFHPVNAGRLATGLPALVPCTPYGCLHLLRQELGDLSGLEAVVIGRSNIVGKPMVQLLLGENCTVTVAHSRTRNLPAVVRRADVVVAAVGRSEMVRGEWIKPGATVIDVGINRIPTDDGKGRLVGDVAYDEVAEIAAAVTPVPGGVGPMTIAMLMRNTVVAAYRRAGLEDPEGL